MAWRTTREAVRAIIETDSNVNVDVFIDTANTLVTYVVTKDTASVLTTALLIKIEEYLAAHFYALKDPQYEQKKTDKASATFQGKTAMGFDSTWWGQTAKRLDVSGTLAILDKEPRAKASLSWLGLPPSEQTDLVDRD